MGSVAGHFSERAWSLAVLPLPAPRRRRLLVVNNLASFAEAWSLERDEVYVFALAQEFVAVAGAHPARHRATRCARC